MIALQKEIVEKGSSQT